MLSSILLTTSFFLASAASVLPALPRADSSYVGYLFVHFYDREPSIFAHLSNGNDPLAWNALNGDNAILVPTVGTGAIRDPHLASLPDDSKHFILGTDLDIDSTNWDAATRTGSRSIIVWESTDLVNWTGERLVEVMPETAGMVWAPEAVWDHDANAFLVVWSSRTYAESDTQHTGTASLDQLWYAHTTDFSTFTDAQIYLSLDIPIIDLTFLPYDTVGNSYARFIKNENNLEVWEERSDNGLFGTWTRVGSTEYIDDVVSEGPLVFWDNQVEDRAYLFLDQYTTAQGYVPFVSDDVDTAAWTSASTSNFPKLVKHGVVKPLTQAQYDTIQTTWG
ncbi:glycoside hydrolase family 43 protein [Cylindrobasidium torrendii FP15055 ss-10]|uniref:Glycoside hydrolase family 43 protein n=1 Tax=Cylindrobasidium torrendii FP15055 ss-10 TaxID=1314674 RepID=A0A0D7BKL1_9AGAR|nr:glycoside hydrolase family 43 protein [Cylindrobasidium torrendii FP15055 ss-10]